MSTSESVGALENVIRVRSTLLKDTLGPLASHHCRDQKLFAYTRWGGGVVFGGDSISDGCVFEILEDSLATIGKVWAAWWDQIHRFRQILSRQDICVLVTHIYLL